MKRILGLGLIVLAAGQTTWILYVLVSGRQVNGDLVLALALPLALGLVGIRWIRKDSQRAYTGRRSDAEATKNSLARRPRTTDMDLRDFTLSGWTLLLLTFLFALGEAACIVFVIPGGNQIADDSRWQILITFVCADLAIGFFLGGRMLLVRLGFPITREQPRGKRRKGDAMPSTML